MFQSNQSLYTRGNVAGSAIAEQVIPELDELQATVISMRKPEPRPHIQDIFAVAVPTTPSPTVEGPPPRFKTSAPLSVPAVGKPRPRRQASTDSSGSDDERSSLQPSTLQNVVAMEAGKSSDTQSLLLNPTSAPVTLVRQATEEAPV